jgi:hypothetical protein
MAVRLGLQHATGDAVAIMMAGGRNQRAVSIRSQELPS